MIQKACIKNARSSSEPYQVLRAKEFWMQRSALWRFFDGLFDNKIIWAATVAANDVSFRILAWSRYAMND